MIYWKWIHLQKIIFTEIIAEWTQFDELTYFGLLPILIKNFKLNSSIG